MSSQVARRLRDVPTADATLSESRLDDWILATLLAESAYSSIYEARSITQTGRENPYAVKLLKPRWQHNRVVSDMFIAEAVVGRRVVHPNLVSVLFARTSADPPYLVMPRYQGRTLASMARNDVRLTLTQVLWTLRQAGEALQALHTAGWLHGDVKPHNLLLDEQGHVTLLDLGFVRRLREPSGWADRPLVGTLRYIAPEMIRSAVRCAPQSDIYSLGVVAYELVAGRPPFQGRSAAELARQHCYERAPAIRKSAPGVPDKVVRLIESMMAKDVLRRPDCMQEVVNTLVRLEIESLGDDTLTETVAA